MTDYTEAQIVAIHRNEYRMAMKPPKHTALDDPDRRDRRYVWTVTRGYYDSDEIGYATTLVNAIRLADEDAARAFVPAVLDWHPTFQYEGWQGMAFGGYYDDDGEESLSRYDWTPYWVKRVRLDVRC